MQINPTVIQAVASRMLDPTPPMVGFFAYTGEQYRKVLGRSAPEEVIDATLSAARERANLELEGMRAGARDFVRGLRRG